MYDPAPIASRVSESRSSLARVDALEREITDLCAQINAAMDARHKERGKSEPEDVTAVTSLVTGHSSCNLVRPPLRNVFKNTDTL